MTTILFERRGFEYSIRFPYNPRLVEIVKTSVPSYARSWHPEVKAWTVDAEFALPLADILRRSGYTVIGLETPRRHEQHDPDDDESRWAHLLFKRVGPAAHQPPTGCCPSCATPTAAATTNSKWNSTRRTPNYQRKGEQPSDRHRHPRPRSVCHLLCSTTRGRSNTL